MAGSDVIQPVVAASVILVRDGEAGMEVFMVRRHIKSDFAADVFVFPGGKAGQEDEVPDELVRMPAIRQENQSLEPVEGWKAVHMAGIRELFEECGVLLAEDATGEVIDLVPGTEIARRFSQYRSEVRGGTLTLNELAVREHLIYAADRLALFSNWVTPKVLSKRFDTFFFAAQVPPQQPPRHTDLHELTDSMWLTPQKALDRHIAGQFPLVFATVRHLEQLGGFESVTALTVHLSQLVVETVRPQPISRNGSQEFVIPGDDGYAEAEVQ